MEAPQVAPKLRCTLEVSQHGLVNHASQPHIQKTVVPPVQLLAAHLEQQAEVTIVTAQIRSPFGLVTFDSAGWVTSFAEKPLLNYYIGSFILERSALVYVTPDMLQKPDGQGLVDFFLALTSLQRLAAFEHAGLQITFNTESERRKAEEDLGQFYTYREDA